MVSHVYHCYTPFQGSFLELWEWCQQNGFSTVLHDKAYRGRLASQMEHSPLKRLYRMDGWEHAPKRVSTQILHSFFIHCLPSWWPSASTETGFDWDSSSTWFKPFNKSVQDTVPNKLKQHWMRVGNLINIVHRTQPKIHRENQKKDSRVPVFGSSRSLFLCSKLAPKSKVSYH